MIPRTEFIKEKLMNCTSSKFRSCSAEGADKMTEPKSCWETTMVCYPTEGTSRNVFSKTPIINNLKASEGLRNLTEKTQECQVSP